MIAFLTSEVALFSTLIVVYLAMIGRDRVGPTPAEALSLQLVICTTAVLLSSSATVHIAERAMRHGSRLTFLVWWAVTIVLGYVALLLLVSSFATTVWFTIVLVALAIVSGAAAAASRQS